jgi:TolB protein
LPDATALIVSGRDGIVQTSQLWQIDHPSGTTRRITNDLGNYQGAVITGDGRSILSVQEFFGANLWVNAADSPGPQQISKEMGRYEGLSGIALAPDGRIAFTVINKGDQDIWIANSDGSDSRQITFNVKANFSPVFTPDGRRIVFVSTRGGNFDIWRMDANGDNPLRLTSSNDQDRDPVVSPDGRYIYYDILDADRKTSIWRVLLEGGTPERVTNFGAERPVLSPDGKTILCKLQETLNDPASKLAILNTEGGTLIRTLDLPSAMRSRILRWSADGSSIVYVESLNRVDNLWQQRIAGGAPQQLTAFDADRIFRFDLGRDGQSFVLARGTERSDVVMVHDFR